MKHFDLVIVGGGIIGTSHALHALEHGLNVALVEKNKAPQGATVRNFGQIVPSGMNAHWQQYGRRSLEIYKKLEATFGITARQNGTVYLASNPEEQTLLEELAEINRAQGYHSELLHAAACVEKYEGLRASYCTGGLFFPEEITLESRRAVSRILAYLQEQRGLTYLSNTLVREVLSFGGGCIVGCSNGQSLQSGQVLICNGSDFQNLFPEIFYESDIDVCKLQMLETQPQATQKIPGSVLTGLSVRRYESFRDCPSWASVKSREAADSLEKQWGVHILFKQSTEGTIIIGDTHEYAPAREADTLGFDLRTDMNDFMLEKAREVFDLQDWGIRRSWAGFYCQCRNADYFEHTIEGRIHLLTGIGGKGMTASPGFAEQHILKILGKNPGTGTGFVPRKKIEMVVFDMAGTTVDEDNTVYKTVHRTVNEAGIAVDYPSVLAHAAGKEKLQAIRDVLAFAAPERAGEAEAIFEHFKTQLDKAYRNGDFKSQPGATEVFEKLAEKGIQVVLNTGYSRPVAELLLRRLGWHSSPLVALTLTADDVQRGRPHPDMIERAMQHFGISDPARVAKIGDSAIDIVEGKNARCGLTFGITTGAHTREQLSAAQPDAVLDSLTELLAWV